MTGASAGEPAPELKQAAGKQVVFWGAAPLTAVDAQVFLQVMFVLEGFSTLAAFELAVSSFAQQLQGETAEKQAVTAAGQGFSKSVKAPA